MTRGFDSRSSFPDQARSTLRDGQLRANLAHATSTIRDKRARVVSELDDWADLRDAGAAIKDHVLANLPELLERLERNVTAHGGVVHWARSAGEANQIVVDLVKATGSTSVVKVKSMVTQEIELNAALEHHGIAAYETDLAELIVQLGDDLPSHILVPAIHKNRTQIRDIFVAEMGRSGLAAPEGLTDEPSQLAAAARAHLRDRFLHAAVGISGANFLIADTGSLVILESEGNGRMCLTLPETLISVVGVEKILPDWASLGVFLQLLPRSSTGERMNPYTTIFTGATPGNGPSTFHLVLLDNGRSTALADPGGREVLRCIRCSACMNVCPVYERTGGHAYGNPYPGPIGAVLVPQMRGEHRGALERSLPFASTLCGACAEVCPMKIDIPRILVKLRSDIVAQERANSPRDPEVLAMAGLGRVFASPRLFRATVSAGGALSKVLRRSTLRRLPPPLDGWTLGRDAPLPPAESFRSWFAARRIPSTPGTAEPGASREGPPPATSRSSGPSSPVAPSGDPRDEMLATLDVAARAGAPTKGASPGAAFRTVGELTEDARLALLADRLVDYRADVTETTPDGVARAVADVLARRGAATVCVPADLPASWHSLVAGRIVVDGAHLTVSDLDQVDATVSACTVAVASTGTIVLDSGPGQGRRVISLIPDHLVLVVEAGQVVELVPEAVARVSATAAQTWISGPSATSDIELERVEGVHGPRHLDVILVRRGTDE